MKLKILKELCNQYANYLQAKHRYADAALMFLKCDANEEAAEAFLNAGNVYSALRIARTLDWDSDRFRSFALKASGK